MLRSPFVSFAFFLYDMLMRYAIEFAWLGNRIRGFKQHCLNQIGIVRIQRTIVDPRHRVTSYSIYTIPRIGCINTVIARVGCAVRALQLRDCSMLP